MGIYDRDYYRNSPGGGFGDFQAWSVTTMLIAINVGVFVLDGLLGRMMSSDDFHRGEGPLYTLGYFSISTAVFGKQIWRFITYQFLHAGLQHILFNMLGLYFFGPIVEGQLGRARYLAFYLSCGVAGALMAVLLWAAKMLVVDAPLIGASAGIFGVLIAGAVMAPGITINLWFPPIQVTLRALAWFFVAVAAYAVLISGENAGGEAAHLGGAAWGYVLIKNQHWLDVIGKRIRRPAARPRRRVAFRDWSRDMNH
jgi:membrane associated rhomboid family serine protease